MKTYYSHLIYLGLFCFCSTIAFADINNISSLETRYKIKNEQVALLSTYFNSKQFSRIMNQYGYQYQRKLSSTKKTFYDNTQLELLNNNTSISINQLSLTKDKNSFDTLIKIQQQIELKTPEKHLIFESRKNRKVISPEDKHPLLGVIKRNDRIALKQTLSQIGLSNYFKLQQILTIETRELKYLLIKKNQIAVIISIQSSTAETFGLQSNYSGLTIKQNSSTIDNSAIITAISNDLSREFPNMPQNIHTEYYTAFNYLTDIFINLAFIIKHQRLYKITQIVFFSIGGFFILLLFFRKRLFFDTKHSNYK